MFLIEGISTKDRASDQFEVLVMNNIKQFITLFDISKDFIVSRPDLDKKFYSDIKISNEDKNIWVEVKLNKYANIGGPSFKYFDNTWHCTTGEDDHITNYMIELLNKHTTKFINFAKSELKSKLKKQNRDLILPKDLPYVMNKWVKANTSKTSDGKLYICDPIHVNDLGKRIVSYYQNIKREPVYYILIGDYLYILDKKYNPLNLKTKDGKDLKCFSDIYKSGTFYFRAKGCYKASTGKYYYSILCDCKLDILPDDADYLCSFKDIAKFPVIEDLNMKKLKIAESKHLMHEDDEEEDFAGEFPVCEFPRALDGSVDRTKVDGGIDKMQVGDDWVKVHFWYNNSTYTIRKDRFIEAATNYIVRHFDYIESHFNEIVTALRNKKSRKANANQPRIDYNHIRLMLFDHSALNTTTNEEALRAITDNIDNVWDDWYAMCLSQCDNMEHKLTCCSDMAAYRCQNGEKAKYAEAIRRGFKGTDDLSIYTRMETAEGTDDIIYYICILPIGWFGDLCRQTDGDVAEPTVAIPPYMANRQSQLQQN